MWLERINLKDFRCFHGEHSIEFSVEPEKNVTLIHAENGFGKTTLLNAMLWCFYSMTTPRFEKKEDLVNYDAMAEGRSSAYVEVTFRHNNTRYRARRYAGKAVSGERVFSIMRLDKGASKELDNPDTFINTVIPKGMANHFLFDGEHPEGFMGEDNRGQIRRAVQDILGCSLIETAIKDLDESASHYRKLMPKFKASSAAQVLNDEIEGLERKAVADAEELKSLENGIAAIAQQIADIEGKLRSSHGAKELQASRDRVSRELERATKREQDAKDDVLKWLGDNGRFLVSTRITELAFDHLHKEETKGKIPSPYNEEFVTGLLDLHKCICGAPLDPGSPAYDAVAGLLKKAANATLRSRLTAIQARLNNLKAGRAEAPGRLDAANRHLADAQEDISRAEAELADISEKLQGIDFGEISERERRRNELRLEERRKTEKIGELKGNLARSADLKSAKERELKRIAETDAGARVFVSRFALCEALRDRLSKELGEEEASARGVLRASIRRILDSTTRKNFQLRMTDDYSVSLVNDAGTQLPKSGGENQLLGLAFTAALVEFAKARENSSDHMLLRGTVAPLVLDSPFGQLDDVYRQTIASYVPKMAQQVILMVSGQQGSEVVHSALSDHVGKEYLLVRHNRADRDDKAREFRQLNGRDYELVHFNAAFDGSSFERVEH